jgi:hypothetical protein
VSALIDKLFAIHDALAGAGLAHAFGGAIALAYCADEPRVTYDLEVRIFTDKTNAKRALVVLPDGVALTPANIKKALRDGKDRLRWDDTPIDVFLNNVPFHDAVAEGVVWAPLAGREVPVLDCASLVVFKALFNRTKDWADIEAVAERSPAQVEAAAVAVAELVGEDDPACERLAEIVATG